MSEKNAFEFFTISGVKANTEPNIMKNPPMAKAVIKPS
jgi:hypothetical protein